MKQGVLEKCKDVCDEDSGVRTADTALPHEPISVKKKGCVCARVSVCVYARKEHSRKLCSSESKLPPLTTWN